MTSSPNILLIIMDSVRAKNTSLHDHDHETTPFLKDFSEQATRYEYAYAPGHYSIVSHVSMFTGHHVKEHGVTSNNSVIDTSATIWSELDRKHEYATGLFTPNAVVARSSNLSDCFQHVTGTRQWQSIPFPNATSPSDIENINETGYVEYLRKGASEGTPLRTTINGAAELANKVYNTRFVDESSRHYFDKCLDWIEGRDEPWAACVNVMDAHYPYLPDDQYDQWGGKTLQRIHKDTLGPYSTTFLAGEKWWKLRAFEALYDGAIYQIDQALERFFQELRDNGHFEDTLIVITSDHGEGFGERSAIEPDVRLIDHSWSVDEELIRVPLVVKHPEQETGHTVETPASLTEFPNVVRTVLDGEWTGQEFASEEGVVSSSSGPIRELPSECENPEDYRGPWRAVCRREGGTIKKYVTRRSTEVTFAVNDAQSIERISNDGGDTVTEVFDDVVHTSASLNQSSAEVGADVQKHLKDLGYVS